MSVIWKRYDFISGTKQGMITGATILYKEPLGLAPDINKIRFGALGAVKVSLRSTPMSKIVCHCGMAALGLVPDRTSNYNLVNLGN